MPFHEDDLDEAETTHFRSLTAAEAEGDERAVEAALRPSSLADFEGQPRVSDQLGLVLEAARHRGGVADQAGATPDVGALLRSALQALSRS